MSYLCHICNRSDKKEILAVAKKDIEYFHTRLSGGDCIPTYAMTTFRQYCEAILILQHGLTGNAVQELCVSAPPTTKVHDK